MKLKSKILRFILWTLGSLLSLLILIYIGFQQPIVQKKITEYIAQNLFINFDLKVKFDRIKIDFWNKVTIENITIWDNNDNTALHSSSASAILDKIDFENHIIAFEKLSIEDANILLHADSLNNLNIRGLIDFIKKGEAKWQVIFYSGEISNSNFSYKNDSSFLPKPFGINYSDLEVSDLNLHASDFHINKGTFSTFIHKLSGKEKSGFSLNSLSAQASITDTLINLSDISIHTEKSHISSNELSLGYNKFADFSDFVSKIKIQSFFNNSILAFSDISYFAPSLKNNPYVLSFNGNIKGRIDDLRAKDLEIYYGKSSTFSGDVEISGLPNIRESFLYINAKKLSANYADLSRLRVAPFSQEKYLKPPKILKDLQTFSYKGNFTGFLTDFVAYGTLTTPAGKIQADVSIKESKKESEYIFAGNVNSDNFNLDKVTAKKNVWGNANFKAKIDGLLGKNSFKTAFVEGNINELNLLGYTYKDISIDGLLSNKKFEGKLEVSDTNIALQFRGLFDYSDEIEKFKFAANVEHANLYALNLVKDSLVKITFNTEIDFTGLQLDNSKGTIDVPYIQYCSKYGNYESNGIYIKVDYEGTKRSVDLTSDLVDIKLAGNGLYKELSSYFYSYMKSHIHSLPEIKFKNKQTIPPNFKASIKIKKINKLLDVLYPQIHIADGTYLISSFDKENNLLTLESKIPLLKIGKQNIKNIEINTEGNSIQLLTKVQFDLQQTKKNIKDVNSELNITNNTFSLNSSWYYKDSTEHFGEIATEGFFETSLRKILPRITISFLPSNFTFGGTIWNVAPSKITIDTTSFLVHSANISNKNQEIELMGSISENPSDIFLATFKNYDIKNLNHIINNPKINLKGELIGSLQIKDFYNSRIFIADVNIPEFYFNNHKMGTMNAMSKWIKEKKSLNTNLSFTKENIRIINAVGEYTPKTKAINYSIKLQDLELSVFQEVFESTMNKFSGYADAKIKATGFINNPNFSGSINLKNSEIGIDYTQTSYKLFGKLIADGSKFVFKDIAATDHFQNKMNISGFFDLKKITNPAYSLNMKTNKILALNTKIQDNPYFYGTVFYKGDIRLSGNMNQTNLFGAGTTIENSTFNIPLSYSELSDNKDFLFFAKSDTKKQAEKKSQIETSSKTNINFNLKVTPNALCQIIFDQKVGDLIRTRGHGDLQFLVNPNGDLTMFGEYNINEGDYLFTLKSLINKKFTIDKGGKITFNGNPLNAQLDVVANYNLKTSPKPLMYNIVDSTSLQSYSKRIPVICKIQLKNQLTQPELNYDIIIPSSSGQITDVVENLNEEQKNIQFLSLLLLSSFMNVEDVNSTDAVNSLSASSYEVLSNQLNTLLSQIEGLEDVDLGFNYRPGDNITGNEFEVSVSTQFLNNRILLNLNSYTEFGQSESVENPNQTNDFGGDISIEVKINKEGNFRVKGFSRNNTDPLDERQGYTHGVGLFFTKEFNYLRDFFRRKKD